MCGIAGFTHKNWNPDNGRIERAVSSLIHRGPDQQGVHRSPICSIGATRLKILDLHGGDQPIYSADRDLVIVFNGEIYNHLDIRKELEVLGHRFVSHCDTETVLHAFQQWDTDCFSRLRGMFAVALWTESQKRLVIARDRMGIKPLFVAQKNGDIFFGSELKTIFVHPEIERTLSLEALDCYLSLNYVPGPQSLVEGIEKLTPGRWLEWKSGQVRSEAYWKLPYGVSQEWTLESAKEKLDQLMLDSVREHLLSDVALGVWLSGGLDSSTVLHYAAQASGTRLKTFSISFRGRSFDETEYIKRVVEQYGAEHEQFDLNPEVNLADTIQEMTYYSDEPMADAGALPVWYLSQMSKTGTTVALSGEGADELFGGYLTYRANRLSRPVRGLPKSMKQLAFKAVKALPVSDDKISFEYKVKRFLEGAMMSPERAHVYWNGTFSDDEKRKLTSAKLPKGLRAILDQVRQLPDTGDDLAPYLWFDQKYYLTEDILAKSDRMSMAHALEVRPAFLDHRIVEFANTLPASLKIKGSRQKLILKELMKDKLPVQTLTRSKVGFDIPAHDWLRGPLREFMLAVLHEGLKEHGALFRAEAIQSYVRAHLERKVNVGYHLWGLIVLFLWMKRWSVQALPPIHEKVGFSAKLGTYI